MIGDRLEFGACDLELVCILYLGIFKFQLRVCLTSLVTQELEGIEFDRLTPEAQSDGPAEKRG